MEAGTHRTPRIGGFARVALIALAVLAGVPLLGIGATYLSATPAVCGACHEMAPAMATWEQSGHTKVACASCHETPRPWYQFAQTLADRAVMLRRDIDLHLSGSPKDAAAIRDVKVPDSTCLQCHDPSRQVTMRFGTLIDHPAHAKRNHSCVSCHRYTAHPDPGAEKPLLLMQMCFDCHGRTSTAKAPGTCDECHPKSFGLRPESHGAPDWLAAHGKLALAGRRQCMMCHEESACQKCHGLEMPHPSGWAAGRTGHGPIAKADGALCAKCHDSKPDVCAMCHHRDYQPAKGTWVSQHPSVVDRRGATFCLECHAPQYCVYCHTSDHTMRVSPAQ